MALKTATVKDLIAALEQEDENALVIVSSDYGDRCHTQQAIGLDARIERVTVATSGYSDSGYKVVEMDDEDYDDEAVFLLLT